MPHTCFKWNLKHHVDFENLWSYVQDLYQISDGATTGKMKHVETHYYRSHSDGNSTRIVPVGSALDWPASPDRAAIDLD